MTLTPRNFPGLFQGAGKKGGGGIMMGEFFAALAESEVSGNKLIYWL